MPDFIPNNRCYCKVVSPVVYTVIASQKGVLRETFCPFVSRIFYAQIRNRFRI
ncbi:MAG: hypothetical protein Ta2A_19810 [Treponemataceae bacterium]|nr:MAG: hypothetical protein Ta2A_19810 [Treponemataceae bacterium]